MIPGEMNYDDIETAKAAASSGIARSSEHAHQLAPKAERQHQRSPSTHRGPPHVTDHHLAGLHVHVHRTTDRFEADYLIQA
jgi:hypothetical protein